MVKVPVMVTNVGLPHANAPGEGDVSIPLREAGWLWCKFLIWLMRSYVSVAFHAARTAFHIVGAVLV
jgi:hypothetical protein